MAARPRHNLLIGLAVAGGLLAACSSGDSSNAATSADGASAAATASSSITQQRAIGQARTGTVPVWLGSYAVLPWASHVERAGRVTFTVSNRSNAKHSFAVIRFDGDPRGLPRSANLVAVSQLHIAAQTDVIDPGREVDVTVDLPEGRYVLTSLFAQDYTDGMAAPFIVGSTPSVRSLPTPPPEGTLGAYLLEYGAFTSNAQVRGGRTVINVQNLGRLERPFALVRWRGAEDALPTQDGNVLLDGLQEVHQFEALAPGETREVEMGLEGGFAYVIISLAKGEYEKGLHTQIRVN